MRKTNLSRSLWAWAACFGSLALLGGCNSLETPQQACVAPETIKTVSQLLNRQAAEAIPNFALFPGIPIDVNSYPQTVQSLWKQNLISIDQITLKSVDKDTKVIRCSGMLKMDGNAGVRAGSDNPGGGVAEVPIEYERQPEANGARYIYRLTSAGNYQMAMLLMVAHNQQVAKSSAPTSNAAQASKDTSTQADAGADLSAIPIAPAAPPAFDAYAATALGGPPVMPDYTGPGADYADYRTRLDDQAKQGVNFAGVVALAQWGCGTGCKSVTAIDLRNGKFFNFPLGGEENLLMDLKFKPNSNLINATWQNNESNDATTFCVNQSFIWTGSGFKQVANSRQQGVCPVS